jgi:hypothetical protein
MTKLDRIEQHVQSLSPEVLADFRKRFQSYDATLWDQQFDRDVASDKLDSLRDEVVAEHDAQETREI